MGKFSIGGHGHLQGWKHEATPLCREWLYHAIWIFLPGISILDFQVLFSISQASISFSISFIISLAFLLAFLPTGSRRRPPRRFVALPAESKTGTSRRSPAVHPTHEQG